MQTYFHTLPPEINLILAQGLQSSVSVEMERVEMWNGFIIRTQVHHLAGTSTHCISTTTENINKFLQAVATEDPAKYNGRTGIFYEPSSQRGIVTLACVNGSFSHSLVLDSETSRLFIQRLQEAWRSKT